MIRATVALPHERAPWRHNKHKQILPATMTLPRERAPWRPGLCTTESLKDISSPPIYIRTIEALQMAAVSSIVIMMLSLIAYDVFSIFLLHKEQLDYSVKFKFCL